MTATAILAKHGIKPNKNQKQKEAVENRAAEIVKEKGPSRNDLMLQAKAKGIKNFRILNREELQTILRMVDAGATEAQLKEEVVDKAVARWKSGWGTKKVSNV